MVNLISRQAEVLANIGRLESYLTQPTGPDAEFARSLIQRGICFVVNRRGSSFFAPSRFVGYVDNSRAAHAKNDEKEGREINAALTSLFGSKPVPNARLDQEYRGFCVRFGIVPRGAGSFGVIRKFWDIR